MADRISRQRRSWNMSRIKSQDTKPELTVRKALHQGGYRYRIHYKVDGKAGYSISKDKTGYFYTWVFLASTRLQIYL